VGTLGDRIEGFDWLDEIEDKLIRKHNVYRWEVEERFFEQPQKLRRTVEDKYLLLSRSASGRYLAIIFVWKGPFVRIISARDMSAKERSDYRQK
jgi:uncharacterized protein